ncbi:MAG: hypothetical protein AAF747_05430 [Planctomycetota bacterium]
MHRPRPSAAAALVLAMFAGLGTVDAARAQDALGDGTGLQRELGANDGTRRGETRSARFQRSLRLRESIIDGSAGAGLSFRRDSDDLIFDDDGNLLSRFGFRGTVASDTLFTIERDASLQTAGKRGLRTSDALAFQFAATTGGALPSGVSGLPVVTRPGQRPAAASGVPGANFRQPNANLGTGRSVPGSAANDGLFRNDADALIGADITGRALESQLRDLRSFSTRIGRAPLSGAGPISVRLGNENGTALVDPLYGVRVQTDLEQTELLSELARLRLARAEVQGDEAAVQRAAGVPTAYDDVVARLQPRLDQSGVLSRGDVDSPAAADRTGRRIGQPTTYDEVFTALRLRLQRPAERLAARQAAEEAAAAAADGELPPPLPTDENEVDTFDPMLQDDELPQLFRALRGVGDERQAELIRPGRPSDLKFNPYAEHMARGQELLTEGKYFLAEERFITALNVKPGDPAALIGQVHAEIGASLLLSAAVNLRVFILAHPEATGARYDASLFPPSERLSAITAALRVQAERDAARADAGLLLAYIGYQLEDADLTREGMDIFDDATERGLLAGKAGYERDAELGTMLRGIWLGEMPQANP